MNIDGAKNIHYWFLDLSTEISAWLQYFQESKTPLLAPVIRFSSAAMRLPTSASSLRQRRINKTPKELLAQKPSSKNLA